MADPAVDAVKKVAAIQTVAADASPAATPHAAAPPAVPSDKVVLSPEAAPSVDKPACGCSKLKPEQQLHALAEKYHVTWPDGVSAQKEQPIIVRAIVRAEADRQGVPENVALGVSGLESGWKMWWGVKTGHVVKLFNESDQSTDWGVMQINNRAHPDAFPCANKDLEFNIRYGVAYLAEVHDEFGDGDLHKGFGAWDRTMAVYNQGTLPTGEKRKKIAAQYLDTARAYVKKAMKYADMKPRPPAPPRT